MRLMDIDGGNISSSVARGQSGCTHSSWWEEAFFLFTQQNLPACKPVLTPIWVITFFLLMGMIFIPIGLVSLRASHSVIEIVDRYDAECVPDEFSGNKVSYIKDTSMPKNCSRFLKQSNTLLAPISCMSFSPLETDYYDLSHAKSIFTMGVILVHKHMKAPIYVYYHLDNYYQNHRRYVKSRSDQQLLHGLDYIRTSSCQPVESNAGHPIVPCGLIAWSLFNDTFTFIRENKELKVNRKNIAWKSDRDYKFGKNVYPFNFQNGSFIGGGKLDPSIPLSDQEDLIVWMRTAALPSFRKLYGRIEEDLDADDILRIHVMNNYNTYSFGGKKKLVLSTSSWLGGKNDFVGLAYVFVGSTSIIISIVFLFLHMKNPRIPLT